MDLHLHRHRRLLRHRGRSRSVHAATRCRAAGGGPLLEWSYFEQHRIYRNGALIATVPNIPGFYTDHIGVRGKGTYSYRVCDAGTQNCSNQVTVKFGGG